ncbi:MAG: 4Fe-4S binding protein [Thermoplasmata archaeon]|nr:4Fe-4S binding protein [Thermoplasmata archaeon]
MIDVDPDVCVLCGLCTGVCPPNALDLLPDRLAVLPHCTTCGWCVAYCPVGALSMPVGAQPRPRGRR